MIDPEPIPFGIIAVTNTMHLTEADRITSLVKDQLFIHHSVLLLLFHLCWHLYCLELIFCSRDAVVTGIRDVRISIFLLSSKGEFVSWVFVSKVKSKLETLF